MSPDLASLFSASPIATCASPGPAYPMIAAMSDAWPMMAILALTVVLLGSAFIRSLWPNKAQAIADEAERPHEILEVRARRAGL